MPRKPNTLETVRLTLELLRRIPRTHKVSAPELHRQLQDAGIERDLRTVQRQLDELSQHFDIERDDSSKPYGYRWKDKAQALSLPGLTPHQSLVLLLAEQYLSTILPASVTRSMDSYFKQAREILAPHTPAQSEREWLHKVRVISTSQPLIPPAIKPGILEAVSQALYANQWLDVEYVNANGKVIKNRVMPLGLAQQLTKLLANSTRQSTRKHMTIFTCQFLRIGMNSSRACKHPMQTSFHTSTRGLLGISLTKSFLLTFAREIAI